MVVDDLHEIRRTRSALHKGCSIERVQQGEFAEMHAVIIDWVRASDAGHEDASGCCAETLRYDRSTNTAISPENDLPDRVSSCWLATPT